MALEFSLKVFPSPNLNNITNNGAGNVGVAVEKET